MNRFRSSAVVLTCVSLLTLTACAGEEAAPPAASAPSTTAAVPSTAPTTSAPSAAAGAETVSDKKLCESAKKAGDAMKEALVSALRSGAEPSPALFEKTFTDLEKELTTVAATGAGDSKVVAALGQFSAEAAKAAAAADPGAAADSPAFAKAGANLSAACKKVGVHATF